MANKEIKQKIEISDIVFDKEIYPRTSYHWQTSYDYSESIKAGAKFPPITLALFKGKKFLIDGKHRLEAYKILKIKQINAIIIIGLNRKQMFVRAIESNIAHGKVLSPYEKRNIILRLRNYNYNPKEISEIIQITSDKLEKFIGTRLINSITGEEIVKSPLSHLAGGDFSPEEIVAIEKSQKMMSYKDQIYLLIQLKNILQNKLLDIHDEKVMKLIKEIKKLLKKY